MSIHRLKVTEPTPTPLFPLEHPTTLSIQDEMIVNGLVARNKSWLETSFPSITGPVSTVG